MTKRQRVTLVAAAAAVALIAALPLRASQQVDTASIDKIKEEGMNRSQVMDIMSYLTDVYGPRLSGSPNIKLAGDWAVGKMKSWGLTNVALEPWADKHGFERGWSNDKFYLAAVSPQAFPIIGTPTAWTPGTKGLIRGEVVCVTGTTEAELAQFKGKLRGKFVISAPAPNVNAFFDRPLAVRQTQEQLDALQAATPRGGGAGGGRAGGGRAGGAPGAPAAPAAPAPTPAPAPVAMQTQAACAPAAPAAGGGGRGAGGGGGGRGGGAAGGFNRNDFLLAEGVVGTLSTAAIGHGVYTVGGNRAADPLKTLPAITITAEGYGRIARLLAKNMPVTLEADIKNTYYPNPMMFNVIGEIRGTDKADEFVMLGGHFDSWHASTGATDNGAGAGAMMEAMRILKASGVTLRRTVRIGLWPGEEQGLIGSAEYAAMHYAGCRPLTAAEAAAAPAPDPAAAGGGRGRGGSPGKYEWKPDHAKFAGYFNIDNGTGAIRGVYLQGNEAVGPIFKEWMKPLNSLGMTHITINDTGGTDHQSFDRVGLPGWQFIQDGIEYGQLTHHTNLDSYERLQVEDMKKNATIAAAFAFLAANRDEKLPRKAAPTDCNIPAPPTAGRGGQ